MSAETIPASGNGGPSAALAAPENNAPPGPPHSPLRTVAVLAFLAIAAAIALGGREALPMGSTGDTGSSAELSASLAVTSSDLAQATSDADGVITATGGYVPGVGIVITAEIDELGSGTITEWTRSVLANVSTVGRLPVEEEVIFLVGVDDAANTSRLVSFKPSEISDSGVIDAREAPATSTAPTRPEFEAPDRLASVDDETESGTNDSE